jgi:hypothetical protein
MQRSLFQKAGIAEVVRVVNRSNLGFPHLNPTYSDDCNTVVGLLPLN